jgi:hypothetical protein
MMLSTKLQNLAPGSVPRNAGFQREFCPSPKKATDQITIPAGKKRLGMNERDFAVERGLRFISRLAEMPECLHDLGADLLWCFHTMSETSKNQRLRRMALQIGQESAGKWKQQVVEPGPDPNELATFIFGVDAAERLLGESDQALKNRLQTLVSSFSAADFLGFDPRCEPPPKDIPELCSHCECNNPRGDGVCLECSAPLAFRSHYSVWQEALVTTYTGEIYGVQLGAPYRDVIRWIPCMRPYPRQRSLPMGECDFDDAFYAITHAVYTLNDYGKFRLTPSYFAQEFDYLRASLLSARKHRDPEMLGESMDTLYSLGKCHNDPDIMAGVEFLLSCQNQDGSWGDLEDEDTYTRFHSTWTAVDGLREYRFGGERDPSDLFTGVSTPGLPHGEMNELSRTQP